MSGTGEEVRIPDVDMGTHTCTQRELQELTGKHKPLPPPITITAPPAATNDTKTVSKPVRLTRLLQAMRDEERAAAKLAPVADSSILLPQFPFATVKPLPLEAAAPHPPKDASPRQAPVAVTITPPQAPPPSVAPPSEPTSGASAIGGGDAGPRRGVPVRFINILRSVAPWQDNTRSKSPRRTDGAPMSPSTSATLVATPPPAVTAPLSARPVESHLCLDPQYTREGMAIRVAALPAVADHTKTAPASTVRADEGTLGHYLDQNAQRRSDTAAEVAATAQVGQARGRDRDEEGKEGTKKTRIADTGTAGALDLAASSVVPAARSDAEVYLIDAEWYRDWQQRSAEMNAKLMGTTSLAQRSTAAPPMPALNNFRLLESPTSHDLRRGVREGTDFVVVTEAMWSHFCEHYTASPAIRRPRIPTHMGQPKTVLYPVYLNVPSMQHGSPITFDETFTLKELKYFLCTKLSQPPHRSRLMLRRADMEATEVCPDDDLRTVFQANLRSGDHVGVQRDGQPDRIDIGALPPPRSSYAASSAQMGITEAASADHELRTQMNVRDNYAYDPAYPSTTRYAGDVMRPTIGASRVAGPQPQSASYYNNDFDDADLAAAIAASLQDSSPPPLAPASAPASAAAPAGSSSNAVAAAVASAVAAVATAAPLAPPATHHSLPPLIPTRTEYRPTLPPGSYVQWLDEDDDTEDDP